jgi:hypothetical protein
VTRDYNIGPINHASMSMGGDEDDNVKLVSVSIIDLIVDS